MGHNNDINDKVDSFIDQTVKWNENNLKQVLPNNVVQDIMNIHLSYNQVQDKMFWGLTTNGQYNTKSGTWLAQGIQDKIKDKCNYHWIWKLSIPQKQITFLWNICVDGLATKQRLCQQRIFVPQAFPICDNGMENMNHLFLDCQVFKKIWAIINRVLKTKIRLPANHQ